MRRSKPIPEQTSFVFEVERLPEPEPPPPSVVVAAPPVALPATEGSKLDAEGHFWWARLGRASQEHCITAASEAPECAEDYALLAKEWKEFAVKHEAKGNCLSEV